MGRFLLMALAAVLVGCTQPMTTPAIDVRLLGPILAEIKEEVGVYQGISQQNRAALEKATPDPALGCGNGKLDFDITKATAKVTVTNVATTSANIGAKIPFGPGLTLGSVSPALSGSHAITNSQVLTFNAYPVLPSQYDGSLDPTNRPIASAILSLKQALLEAATHKPCFSTVHDPAKDPDNTFDLGFQLVDDGKGGISLTLAVITIGVSQESQTTRGNTVTIAFAPVIAGAKHPPKAAGGKAPLPVRPGGDQDPSGEFSDPHI